MRGRTKTQFKPVPGTNLLEWKNKDDSIEIRYQYARVQINAEDLNRLHSIPNKQERKTGIIQTLGHHANCSTYVTAVNQFLKAMDSGAISLEGVTV